MVKVKNAYETQNIDPIPVKILLMHLHQRNPNYPEEEPPPPPMKTEGLFFAPNLNIFLHLSPEIRLTLRFLLTGALP